MKNLNKRNAGFSLIEMLIYISLLVFMLIVIINILNGISKSGRLLKSSKNIDNSALVSMERIVREIRLAESVSASSTLGVNPGTLILSGVDDLNNPRTVEFGLDSGLIIMHENGVGLGPLNLSEARVTNLVFNLLTSSSSRAVRTQMTIESGTSTWYKSEKFYSTTILRKSL